MKKKTLFSVFLIIVCVLFITFHNVRIAFQKGMIYDMGENSIAILDWKLPKNYLYIAKKNLSYEDKEKILLFLKNKNFKILETKNTFFKKHESFTITYIDSTSNYNKSIYVIPKNIEITYVGAKENYRTLKHIIDKIEFTG